MKPLPSSALTLCLAVWLLAGCTALLPRSKETTASPWQTYREAQQTFDDGVQECVKAKTVCRGLEINQRLVQKHRNGSFWLDVLGFKRETHTEGFRFNALVLLKNGVVVYKLTGGWL